MRGEQPAAVCDDHFVARLLDQATHPRRVGTHFVVSPLVVGDLTILRREDGLLISSMMLIRALSHEWK